MKIPIFVCIVAKKKKKIINLRKMVSFNVVAANVKKKENAHE